MSKILLIEPPPNTKYGVMRIMASIGTNKVNWKFPPIDLMFIAGALRKNKINDFIIIDALNNNINYPELENIIVNHKPEVVIFTFTVFTIKNDMRIASIVKSISKDIKTIAVNFAAESYIGNILNDFQELDFLAYHEPENPVVELIKGNFNPENVSGIYYRKKNQIIKTPEKTIVNLDDIGIPVHTQLSKKIYNSPYQKKSPMTATSFSRGCVNMCVHCIGSRYLSLKKGGHIRFRSYGNILEEINSIKELGFREIRLFDSEINADLDWAEGLFNAMINKKLTISFSGNLRANNITERFLTIMKQAGCHLVSLGIDSVSQDILDNMKKNLTVKDIINTIKLIKKAGIRLTTYTTFGQIGETKQSVYDTIDFIKKVNPDMSSFSIAVPIVGTEFYDFLKEKRYLLNNTSLEEFDPNAPPVYSYPDLSSKELYDLSMFAYRSFYFRFQYLFKRLIMSYSLRKDLSYMKYCLERYFFEPLKYRKNVKRHT